MPAARAHHLAIWRGMAGSCHVGTVTRMARAHASASWRGRERSPGAVTARPRRRRPKPERHGAAAPVARRRPKWRRRGDNGDVAAARRRRTVTLKMLSCQQALMRREANGILACLANGISPPHGADGDIVWALTKRASLCGGRGKPLRHS